MFNMLADFTNQPQHLINHHITKLECIHHHHVAIWFEPQPSFPSVDRYEDPTSPSDAMGALAWHFNRFFVRVNSFIFGRGSRTQIFTGDSLHGIIVTFLGNWVGMDNDVGARLMNSCGLSGSEYWYCWLVGWLLLLLVVMMVWAVLCLWCGNLIKQRDNRQLVVGWMGNGCGRRYTKARWW